MDGAPQPIGADVVAPLGHHLRQQASDALVGGHRHGLPTLGLGVLVATADLAISDGEQTGFGQREAVDIAAQVVQDFSGPCTAGWP
jgi:hypothetical protein